jgi:PDZ domain
MKKLVLFVFAWVSLTGFGFVSAQVQPEAQVLIDKAIVAHGGRAAIEGIKTMVRLEVGRYIATDGIWYSEGWREISDVTGRRYRNENISNGVPFAVGQETEAGALTWSWDEGVKSLERNAWFRDMDSEVLRLLLAPMKYAQVLGPRTVFGVAGTAVTFKLPKSDDDFSYLFANDGTILARAFDTDFFPTGRSTLFADYRDVAGVRVFFSYRSVKNGELVQEYRAVEVQINQPLADALFAWPPVIPEQPKGRIGIGMEHIAGQGIKVTVVTADSAAAKAGVFKDDLILEVDGVSMADWNDLKPNGLRGEPGTVVVLTIKRGDQVLKISVTRATI